MRQRPNVSIQDGASADKQCGEIIDLAGRSDNLITLEIAAN
jgi:hypothetical protein